MDGWMDGWMDGCIGRAGRGKRASALVKFRQRGLRMPLPSIHLVNLCSLLNKTDELLLLSRTTDFSYSAALCFTKTWLKYLLNFQLMRADRNAESMGKSRGGGTCFHIN